MADIEEYGEFLNKDPSKPRQRFNQEMNPVTSMESDIEMLDLGSDSGYSMTGGEEETLVSQKTTGDAATTIGTSQKMEPKEAADINDIRRQMDKEAALMATRHAFMLSLTIMTGALGLAFFGITIANFSNTSDMLTIVERIVAHQVESGGFRRSIALLDRNSKQESVVTHDLLCYLIALETASAQNQMRRQGQDLSSLLQVNSEMIEACAQYVSNGIERINQDEIVIDEGCYSSKTGEPTTDVNVGLCVAPFPLETPSVTQTGLMPETVTNPNTLSLFVGSVANFPGYQLFVDDDTEESLSRVFVANPLLGSFYSNQPYYHVPKTTESVYGLAISYSYATKSNKDYVNLNLGGGGSGITPSSIYPNDGVLYVDMNVRNAKRFGGSFGKITAVFESATFDGPCDMHADREIIVLSGKRAISGWDISAGLDSAISRPTLYHSLIASSTEDPGQALALVSPCHLVPYIDDVTGKRYFLIGMKDTVEPGALTSLYCNSFEEPPSACGGFAILDRDALWQSTPASAITRLGPIGLNNGLVSPTPGDIALSRTRNIFISTTSFSTLFSEQEPCFFVHYFVAHVLDRPDLVDPNPGYDFDLLGLSSNVDYSATLSFYQHSDATLLFNLSTRWVDVGDLLYYTQEEVFDTSPPELTVGRNQIHFPNLDVVQSWKYATGYAPTALKEVSSDNSNDLPIFYGIDFYTGGLFAVSPTDAQGNSYQSELFENENVPWRVVYVAWLPYVSASGIRHDRPPLDSFFPNVTSSITQEIPDILLENPFLQDQLLPYPTDLLISRSGKYIFVAASGLGRVVVYRRKQQDRLSVEYCSSYQTTIGQYNATGASAPEHPRNPGVPLHSGPANLAVDYDDLFLYVTTGSHKIDECIYPAAEDFGGVVLRYSISGGCDSMTLRLDPSFLITAHDLPSHLSASSSSSPSSLESIAASVRARPPVFGDISFI